ncbi:flagella basal body P-ring formation protein FlgA [Sphingomonas sp. RT2P30]|uniref:flagella basal body P-ring formation protein FlgA n=1 Tax=Parasphingomonas halimpatiens TaxID=3096162 RepID=UPI002FC9FAD9
MKEPPMLRPLLALLPITLLATAATAAAPYQDTLAIDRAVAAFTGHATGDAGGARTPVDTRLRLANCSMVSLAWRGEARDAVVVTCTEPEWRIFVPVRLGATPTPAPAAAAPTMAAAPARLAPVIKRGDPVTIAAGTNGFSITRDGIALGDAAPGARFLVKCEGSKNPVQAIAIESGRATLPGWNE